MAGSSYQHIWDCCCDHGLLGAALLSRRAANCIHFVDIVPEIISTVDDKLHRFFGTVTHQWQTHCMDATNLPLQHFTGKHLVIIAGVGGDLVTTLVTQLLESNPETDMDFLLCPVHHQFILRQQLIALNCRLIDEVLIEENQRYYEILRVSSPASRKHQSDTQEHNATPSKPISPVGEYIWQARTNEQKGIVQTYLHKTIAHYQRIQQGKTADVDAILHAYRCIQLQ